MKRLLLTTFILPLLGVFTGCKNDEPEVRPDEPGVEECKLPAISKEGAVAAAASVMMKMGYISNSRLEDPDVILYSGQEATDTAFYLVKYAGHGYVAINANPASPVKVLAVSDSDVLPEMAESYILAALKTLRKPGNNLPANISLPVEPYKSDTSKLVLPTPLWDENTPYNKYCFTPDGEQSVVGSVPLAIGMVLAYHRTPEKAEGLALDWDQMLAAEPTEEAYDMIAHLLHEIGVKGKAIYTPTQAKIGHGEIIRLLSDFGLTHAYKAEDWDNVITSLYYKDPAIISGRTIYDETWTWLIDGYMVITDLIPVKVEYENQSVFTPIVNRYYHFNWGLKGAGDGYFTAGSNYSPAAIPSNIEQITVGVI